MVQLADKKEKSSPSKSEKKQQRAERRAERKAENEKLYQEVMGQSPEEAPEQVEEPKKNNKWVKRGGVVAFVLINAAVIYFTAANEFSKKAPDAERIYSAGEKEWNVWLQRKDTGVPINESVQAEFSKVRDDLGLDYKFPWD